MLMLFLYDYEQEGECRSELNQDSRQQPREDGVDSG